MKGFKKDKVSKKTAKKIMVALACMMATQIPFTMPIAGAAEIFAQDADNKPMTTGDTTNPTTSGDADGKKGKIDSNLAGVKEDRLYGGKAASDGSATNNEITVEENGAFAGRIIGGQSGDAADETKQAAGNKVTVNDKAGTIGSTDIGAAIIGGEAKGASKSEGNEVSIKGGNITGQVIGGRAKDGLSTGNKVTIEKGTITEVNAVFGGSSASGDAKDNRAIISGGTITGAVMGGYANADGKVASGNVVEISGETAKINGQIDGGRAQNGRADGNTVKVTGGTINNADKNAIIGGNGTAGAKGNSVNVSDGTIQGSIYGGFSEKGDVGAEDRHNTVKISGGTLTSAKEVIGGHAKAGSANYNDVDFTVTKDTSVANVLGGYSASDDGKTANNNTVTISGTGTLTAFVDGGRSKTGDAQNNTVVINGNVTGTVTGGNAAVNGSATGNQVTIGSAKIAGGDVVGGASAKLAQNNSVTLKTGAKVEKNVYGGLSNKDATDNSVVMEAGEVSGDIRGGYTSSGGKADNNSVSISGGKMNGTVTEGTAKGGSVIGGHGNGAGSTTIGNQVTIKGATVNAGDVIGGYKTNSTTSADNKGETSKNKVVLEGVTVDNSDATGGVVAGGYTNYGDAKDNEVTITGGEIAVNDKVVGGLSRRNAATGNIVTIVNAKKIQGDVYGGASGAGDVTGNSVSIQGGEVSKNVIGASSDGIETDSAKSGSASKNKVTIKDVKFTGAPSETPAEDFGYVVGGRSMDKDAEGNEVSVTGSTVSNDVIGGQSKQGGAINNIVEVTGGSAKNVHGGRSENGKADGNKVTVGGEAKISGTATAAEAAASDGAVIGGRGVAGAANNTVTVNDITARVVIGGSAVNGSVTKNIVRINGGTISEAVDGGRVDETGDDISGTYNQVYVTKGTIDLVRGASLQKGNAADNAVQISGGTIEKGVYGGHTESGDATGNAVEISDGTIKKEVVGGKGTTTASNNRLTITGGEIQDHVYGGVATDDEGVAKSNTIAISGNPTFAAATNIVAASIGTGDKIAARNADGNNISFGADAPLTKAISVNSVQADKLTIGALGGDALSGSAAIKAKGVKASSVDISNVTLDRVVDEDFALVEATENLEITEVADGMAKMRSTLQQKVGKVGNKIEFTGPRTVQEQTGHALLNAQAGVAALAAGNTLIERAATGLEADGFTGDNPQEWRAFAYVGGGRAEYSTGSSVTTSTWNGMVGFGRHDKRKDGGSLTYGVFYEYGNGNYSTDDSSGKGDGQATYMGGGLLAKNETAKGFYYEGSLRAGRMTNDARNILRVGDKTYGYNKSSGYWGFHLGAGRVLRYNNGRSLDVYGKYFYNRLNGFSFDAEGRYDLDDVKTSLLRLGTRYNFWKQAGWTSYGGFAYEYEFGGEAGGFADGYAIPKADLGGSSAMFELGMKLQPDENSPWGVDLNLTAHAGQRKGVMGGATVSYAF